jgi:hypothetical protein
MRQVVHMHLETKIDLNGSLEKMSMRIGPGRSSMVVHDAAADGSFEVWERGRTDLLPLLLLLLEIFLDR